MVIPWNALGVVGGAIVFVYDRTKDKRAKAKLAAGAPPPMPPAPAFENGPADIALFTSFRGEGLEVRHFDEDLKPELLKLLDVRGLRHVPPSTLAETAEQAAALAALGSFYMVVPLLEGQTSAGETVRTCEESGGVVLGSLSLIALPLAMPPGQEYPMLVAIGGAALEKSANEAGEFAVLSKLRPATETAKTDPPPPVEVAAEVVDLPKPEHANGAAKPERAVLGNVVELAKEEGT